MSHSVVKVTETPINNSLVLVIDKDGYVTPDKKTVEEYLSSRTGETELHIMQVNKSDGKTMDVTVDTLTYLSCHNEEGTSGSDDMNEIERNLMSFRMDHDYTPFTYGEMSTSTKEITEIDELAETLSILEGSNIHNEVHEEVRKELPPPRVVTPPPKPEVKPGRKLITINSQPLNNKRKVKLLSNQSVSKPFIKTNIKNVKETKPVEPVVEDEDEEEEEEEEQEEDDKEYSDEDFLMDSDETDDDANDSDYEVDEFPRSKTTKRGSRNSRTSVSSDLVIQKPVKVIKTIKPIVTRHSTETKVEPESIRVQKPPEVVPDAKTTPEKKVIPKKDKKAPKPIPDDFALFSSPDIIRRVGGTSNPVTPTTPSVPESPKSIKPAKIFHGALNKSVSDRISAELKHKRLSADGKIVPFDQEPIKQLSNRLSVNSDLSKRRDRRISLENKKMTLPNIARPGNATNLDESLGTASNESMELEPIPSAEDIRAIIQNEDTKTFTSNLVIPEPSEQQADQSQINLENTGLDLDQSLLDNINSDLIPEDILYQVAQSLVGNAELQNAIDKSIVDGNLVLDTNDHPTVHTDNTLVSSTPTTHSQHTVETTPLIKGTQILRSGGRVVVIPPIERPATRSRNRHKPDIPTPSIAVKTNKLLDDEHVSGGELDSSSEGERSDDDDPDKLWCICNQPHNNRFMICCDSCEEWYHGKCVNVTKAMGHMMEVKGKEWICLYCKDPSLLRPEAAARRIRKASHTSSTDLSPEKKEKKSTPAPVGNSTAVPGCLVCGKPSRINSIYCSDPCILKHAKVVEKVVVFERSSGTIYTGSSAPSTTNLDKWLQQHPGFEVVRSANANKPVTTKQVTHSKLKTIKSNENSNTAPPSPTIVPRKSNNANILRQSSKSSQSQLSNKQITGFKIVSKKVTTPPRTKLIQAPPLAKSSPPAVTPTKPKPVQNATKTPAPTPTKEKPVPQKTPKSRQPEDSMPQSNQEENIRDNVKKTLFEQLTNRLNLVEDIKLTKDELTKISSEIESQLYKCFGDTGQKYRNKYRSLIFNIKDTKNQTLWRRICQKSINAYQLVRLSPDDLASQELALWRERENKHQLEMITKSELEQLGRNRQYVFKTHKGEQVLEDNRPSDAVDNTEVVMGLGTEGSSESVSDGKKDSKDKDRKHSRADKHRDHNKSNKDRDRSNRDRKREHSSSGDKTHHKRSKSKDSSRHSDKHRSNSREKDRYHRSSHKSSRHKKDMQSATEKLDKKSKEILEQLVDNKIVPPLEDRLWRHVQQEDITTAPTAESDSDHEPTSTVTIPTPPRVGEIDDPESTSPLMSDDIKMKDDSSDDFNTSSRDIMDAFPSSIDENILQSPPLPRSRQDFIWKGTINMVDVAQISITAHEVSGDCAGLGEELPVCLDVVGRISPETVWDYIGKMKCSNSKAISLLRLNATNIEEKMPYIALYSYLSSRNRLGVIKSINKAVKDFYILPLASQKPLPQSLLPLSGPGFEESRPALLLGIIVRDKRKRPLFVSNPPPTVIKKQRVQVAVSMDRSYTPPPNSDTNPKVKTNKEDGNDEDEPYTPEDSDPDTVPNTTEDKSSNMNSSDISNTLTPTAKSSSFLETGLAAQTFEPFSNKFDTIPGLDESAGLPANSQEIQRKMEELDQRIAMQKAEIQNMSQDIAASSTTSGIGTTALASIALPQNLQQILDSIKGINPGSETETVQTSKPPSTNSDLTIPLILPKISARTQPPPSPLVSSSTIPLNLPKSKKITSSPQNSAKKVSPHLSEERSTSVLSSLSEEDLIRKAAEMLGETPSPNTTSNIESPPSNKPMFNTGLYTSPPSFVPPPPLSSLSSKSAQLEIDQPPIPGLD